MNKQELSNESKNKSVAHRLSAADAMKPKGYFRRLKGSEKVSLVLSCFGSMFGIGIYNHPMYYLKTGVVGYMLACFLAFSLNQITYTTLVKIGDRFGYRNYADTAKYLEHPIFLKMMNVLFITGYIFRIFGPYMTINESLANLMSFFGKPNYFLDSKFSFYGFAVAALALFPLVVQKKLGKVTATVYLSLMAYLLIIIFSIRLTPVIPENKNSEGYRWFINFKEFPITFFYLVTATTIHGNVMMIYDDLSIKKIQTMDKVLYIAFTVSSIVYPIFSIIGGRLLIKTSNIDNLPLFQNLIKDAYTYFPIMSILMTFFNILIGFNAIVFNFMAFRNTILGFFVPKNTTFDSFVTSKINFLMAVWLNCMFMLIGSFVTMAIPDFTIGVQLNSFIVSPLLYIFTPLLVENKMSNGKSLYIKILFCILLLAYLYTAGKTIYKLFFK